VFMTAYTKSFIPSRAAPSKSLKESLPAVSALAAFRYEKAKAKRRGLAALHTLPRFPEICLLSLPAVSQASALQRPRRSLFGLRRGAIPNRRYAYFAKTINSGLNSRRRYATMRLSRGGISCRPSDYEQRDVIVLRRGACEAIDLAEDLVDK